MPDNTTSLAQHNQDSGPIDDRILEEAAGWLMQLHASTVSDADRLACEQWRQRSPEHARAWRRAELLSTKLGGLHPAIALPTLGRNCDGERRAAIKKLALLLAAAPLGWGAYRALPWERWRADFITGTGEQRTLQLSDGTRVLLDTHSAIGVDYTNQQRLLTVRAGAVLVQTAPDTATRARAFFVVTGQGRMHPLGTRFSVRLEGQQTQLAVLEGSVAIQPREQVGTTPTIVPAGTQTLFTRSEVRPPAPLDDRATAWTQGMLLADNTRLSDFIAELAAYRRGVLRCDPAVAELRISGTFPALDTGRTLAILESIYPVRATFLSPYWVTLGPR